MNGKAFFRIDRAQTIHGLANYVDHPPQRGVTDRNRDWAAFINGLHAAHHAVCGLHSDAAHPAFTNVLLHFQNDVDRLRDVETVTGDANGFVNRWQRSRAELHIHRRTGDLNYLTYVLWHESFSSIAIRNSLA